MFFWFFGKKLQISQKDSKSIGRGKGKSRFCLVLHENYKFQDFVKQKTEFRAKTLKYRKGPEILFLFDFLQNTSDFQKTSRNYKFQDFVNKTKFRAKTHKYRKGPELFFCRFLAKTPDFQKTSRFPKNTPKV